MKKLLLILFILNITHNYIFSMEEEPKTISIFFKEEEEKGFILPKISLEFLEKSTVLKEQFIYTGYPDRLEIPQEIKGITPTAIKTLADLFESINFEKIRAIKETKSFEASDFIKKFLGKKDLDILFKIIMAIDIWDIRFFNEQSNLSEDNNLLNYVTEVFVKKINNQIYLQDVLKYQFGSGLSQFIAYHILKHTKIIDYLIKELKNKGIIRNLYSSLATHFISNITTNKEGFFAYLLSTLISTSLYIYDPNFDNISQWDMKGIFFQEPLNKNTVQCTFSEDGTKILFKGTLKNDPNQYIWVINLEDNTFTKRLFNPQEQFVLINVASINSQYTLYNVFYILELNDSVKRKRFFGFEINDFYQEQQNNITYQLLVEGQRNIGNVKNSIINLYDVIPKELRIVIDDFNLPFAQKTITYREALYLYATKLYNWDKEKIDDLFEKNRAFGDKPVREELINLIVIKHNPQTKVVESRNLNLRETTEAIPLEPQLEPEPQPIQPHTQGWSSWLSESATSAKRKVMEFYAHLYRNKIKYGLGAAAIGFGAWLYQKYYAKPDISSFLGK